MHEISKIIDFYDDAKRKGIPTCLAAVVEIAESSYRRIGARMLVEETGDWVGGISGGCLEGDALKKAKMSIITGKSQLATYDTREGDDYQIGVGLGCKGKIDVLFIKLDYDDPSNEIELLKQHVYKRTCSYFAKIITSPSDQSLLGTIEAISLKNTAHKNAIFEQVDFDSKINSVSEASTSLVFDVEIDGKPIRLLIEQLKPRIHLVVIGSNYDVYPLINVAAAITWKVSLIGKVAKYKKEHIKAVSSIVDKEQISTIALDEYTALIFLTHDYDTDLNILPYFLGKNLPYIGMLGPKKRVDSLNEDLKMDLRQEANLYGPVGLDIGAETPEEIALAIVTEIISVFRKRKGGFLRERGGAIYKR